MILINIGDELLIGQVINTNAAFMAQQFNAVGIEIEECIVIRDREDEIKDTIASCFQKSNFIVMTGGLGPTKDDKTKQVICDYFHTTLVKDEHAKVLISKLLKERGASLTGSNLSQAMVPQGSIVLPNYNGTAQGIWIENEGKVLVALPGVPFEMKRLLVEEVLPLATKKFSQNIYIQHRVVQTAGIAESALSDLLESWEAQLPECIQLAYLPRPGIIRLRLTGKGDNPETLEKLLQQEVDKLIQIAKAYIWSCEDNQLEEVLGALLAKRHKTVAVAESCTGGFLSHLFTAVPGSSAYFKGSVVSYSNEIKREVLNVREPNLKKHGAVSEEVVSDMALNVMNLMDVDYSIAISGIAGPEGGSEDKPVGTVWIAVATTTKLTTQLFHFGSIGGRSHIIQLAAVAALNMLRIEMQRERESCDE
ncbi:MAG: competence/damage-inducible protein A [Bacteroidales bacterium]|jgi:nicotinamide-nucleotide amidase|nr:competence/damage-inducible protein A [Bacteroidales bacterium]